MAEIDEASKAPSENDLLHRQWPDTRSILHEQGHRFNSGFAKLRNSGKLSDPQKMVQYLAAVFDHTAALAVKTVTSHESAARCCDELATLLSEVLKRSSKLFRLQLPPESRKGAQTELRRRLLERSEHWKAEAYKRGRLAERARVRSERIVTSDDHAGGLQKTQTPAPSPASRILIAAMERRGLTAPALARKVQKLQRPGQTKPKVDRTTVYRILNGQTKKPNPAILKALMETLQLDEAEALAVRRELGRTAPAPTSKQDLPRKK